YIKRALSLLKPKIKKINDFANLGFYFFKDPEQYDEAAIKKYWHDELVKNQLKTVVDRLSRLDAFEAGTIESAIRNLAEESGISAAKLIHPIRLALTGFGVSPGLFELMEVLGKESVLRRINNAVNWLTK
ncbi:glutamate--tRNA ligase, partial [candidate division KSB1 bacterium]|nr:glutamate--tRNA ligase [candidate division KSB1 bacterium]